MKIQSAVIISKSSVIVSTLIPLATGIVLWFSSLCIISGYIGAVIDEIKLLVSYTNIQQ